jgi:hypothetical protein
MSDRTHRSATDPNRASKYRDAKAGDIQSGKVKARAIKSRTDKRSRAGQPPTNSVVTRSSAYIEPEARDARIAEAAYFRSAHRGFEPGHDVDDWLAAEVEIDEALARGDLPRFME